MNFYYARCSSVGQSTERQLADMPKDIDRVYEEKVSGKNVDRPELTALLLNVRSGDKVYCHSLDRLARNTKDLLTIVETITEKGSCIEFLKEKLTFTPKNENPISHLMLTILGSIAQFERSLIRERQMQGIAIAKTKGKYKGGTKKLSPEQVQELQDLVSKGSESISAIGRRFKISRVSVYRYMNG